MNQGKPSDRDAVLSTLDGIRTTTRRPALWARRAVVTVLTVVVGVAALGFLGVHSTTSSASADGYTVTVTYAWVARAGWDVPLRIQVQAPEPLAGKRITVTVDRVYLALFETQGLWPEPADESGDLGTVLWEFDGPDEGNDLTIDYDAYIEPNAKPSPPAAPATPSSSQTRCPFGVHPNWTSGGRQVNRQIRVCFAFIDTCRARL